MGKIFDIAKDSEQSWGTIATAIDENNDILYDKIEEKLDIFTTNLINEEEITWGAIMQNGSVRAIEGQYGYTGMIYIGKNDIITNGMLADGNNVTFEVYDKYKIFLRDIKSPSGSTAQYTYTEGDAYIIINLFIKSKERQANYGTYLNEYKPYNPIGGYTTDIDTRLTALEESRGNIFFSKDQYKAIFQRIICIGDSMTSGYRTEKGDNKDLSYPTYMSRMSGWVCENAAKGGRTPKGWWNEDFSNYTYTNYDVAIIYLGQNEGLTETVYTDAPIGTSYSDYADTNTGRYCSIIEGIKTANPNIKIFLLKGTAPASWNNNPKGITIDTIAERYGCVTLDINNNGFVDLLQEKYHPYVDSSGTRDTIHYGTIGYMTLGRVIYSLILKYLSEHEEEFSNYLE